MRNILGKIKNNRKADVKQVEDVYLPKYAFASIPSGIRLYCIGDVHGCIDALEQLHQQIIYDTKNYLGHKVLVYIGDYIDRGSHSKEVVDKLIYDPLPGFEIHSILGNHEQTLLDFLFEDHNIGKFWLEYGGDKTLESYGIRVVGVQTSNGLKLIQKELLLSIPEDHLTFYNNLKVFFTLGDYFFVHAGIRPGVPLREQSKSDLLWIRNEFVNSKGAFEKIIVHGHTVSGEPQLRPNRIGIDTGAYASSLLSCVVLEKSEVRFLFNQPQPNNVKISNV